MRIVNNDPFPLAQRPSALNGWRHTKSVGGISFSYYGVHATISDKAATACVTFKGKAGALPDEGAGMDVSVPPNMGIVPLDPPPNIRVFAFFEGGDSATTCASKLAKALNDKVGGGYVITARGPTVTIDRMLME
jgi:hypothetical protein